MLRNYYWDYAVSKSVYVYFHSREEVRLELDSSWTLVGLQLDSPFTTKTVVYKGVKIQRYRKVRERRSHI